MPSLQRVVEPSITLFPWLECRGSRYLAITPGAARSKHPRSRVAFRVQPRRMKSHSSLPWEQMVPQAHCISPKSITRHEVLEMLEADQRAGADFLLVDVRRDDHQGLTISGSLNMPIQTLQPSLPTLYRFCVTAEVKRVIFYCGHSTGRGPRAAGLFDDEVRNNKGETKIESLVLREGFNGWLTAGEVFDRYTTCQTT